MTTFYGRVGELMGMTWVPGNYGEAATFLDGYEASNLGPSPEGASLMAAAGGALSTRLPKGVRWASGLLTSLMLDDALCRRAVA